jgi:ATP-dependent Lon protease
MNRREKRAMEKKLGITKYKKTLSMSKRFEMIEQNIIEGNNKQQRLKEEMRIRENSQADSQINKKIADRALDLMMKEDMDYYSATQKAKEEFGQNA